MNTAIHTPAVEIKLNNEDTITFHKVSYYEGTKHKVEGGFRGIDAANTFAERMKQRGMRGVEVTSYTEAR